MQGRRLRLTAKLFDNYIGETEENQIICQEVVLDFYYKRNNKDMVLTFEEIKNDILSLELQEQYERCLLLKDILDNFE